MNKFTTYWLPPIIGTGIGLVVIGMIVLAIWKMENNEIGSNSYLEIARLLKEGDDTFRSKVVEAMQDNEISNWEYQKLIELHSKLAVQKFLVEK